MKYRPIRKQLTHEDANDKYMVVQQSIGNEIENITYWSSKEGKIDQYDGFILHVGGFKSPEECIKAGQEKIDYLMEKLKDLRRFFEEGKEIRSIHYGYKQ